MSTQWDDEANGCVLRIDKRGYLDLYRHGDGFRVRGVGRDVVVGPRSLKATTLDEAKIEALDLVRERLTRMLAALGCKEAKP